MKSEQRLPLAPYVKVDMWQQYREAYSESWENNLVALHSNFSPTEPEIWV